MDDLVDARKKAEAAVQGMPEGEMKTKAFEVILHHLLAQGSTPLRSSGAAQPVRLRGVKRSRTRRSESSGGGMPRYASDRILSLREEGFFQDGRGMREVKDELQAHGWMYKLNAISGPLMKLVRQRQLRRAAFSNGNKKVFKYFNS